MEYFLLKDERHLYVTLWNEATFAETTLVWCRILRNCRDLEVDRVLVTNQTTGGLSPQESSLLVRYLLELGYAQPKVAIVNAYGESWFDLSAAQAAQMDIREFSGYDAATDWLHRDGAAHPWTRQRRLETA